MMKPEVFEHEKRYQAALSVAKGMLKSDIISDDDYREILTVLAAKYRPFFASI